jgi:protein-S-isoprenylcysteine O-methyltransferase Ste14
VNAVKTLLAAILVPGVVTVAVPAWILSATGAWPPAAFGPLQLVALPLAVLGVYLIVEVCVSFVREGKGTPIPIDPPKEFVRSGGYRFVRNPMYFGALLILTAEVIATGSIWVLLFGAFLWLALHLFLVIAEEPQLLRRFGESYAQYMRDVPRWIPRFPKRAA